MILLYISFGNLQRGMMKKWEESLWRGVTDILEMKLWDGCKAKLIAAPRTKDCVRCKRDQSEFIWGVRQLEAWA